MAELLPGFPNTITNVGLSNLVDSVNDQLDIKFSEFIIMREQTANLFDAEGKPTAAAYNLTSYNPVDIAFRSNYVVSIPNYNPIQVTNIGDTDVDGYRDVQLLLEIPEGILTNDEGDTIESFQMKEMYIMVKSNSVNEVITTPVVDGEGAIIDEVDAVNAEEPADVLFWVGQFPLDVELVYRTGIGYTFTVVIRLANEVNILANYENYAYGEIRNHNISNIAHFGQLYKHYDNLSVINDWNISQTTLEVATNFVFDVALDNTNKYTYFDERIVGTELFIKPNSDANIDFSIGGFEFNFKDINGNVKEITTTGNNIFYKNIPMIEQNKRIRWNTNQTINLVCANKVETVVDEVTYYSLQWEILTDPIVVTDQMIDVYDNVSVPTIDIDLRNSQSTGAQIADISQINSPAKVGTVLSSVYNVITKLAGAAFRAVYNRSRSTSDNQTNTVPTYYLKDVDSKLNMLPGSVDLTAQGMRILEVRRAGDFNARPSSLLAQNGVINVSTDAGQQAMLDSGMYIYSGVENEVQLNINGVIIDPPLVTYMNGRQYAYDSTRNSTYWRNDVIGPWLTDDNVFVRKEGGNLIQGDNTLLGTTTLETVSSTDFATKKVTLPTTGGYGDFQCIIETSNNENVLGYNSVKITKTGSSSIPGGSFLLGPSWRENVVFTSIDEEKFGILNTLTYDTITNSDVTVRINEFDDIIYVCTKSLQLNVRYLINISTNISFSGTLTFNSPLAMSPFSYSALKVRIDGAMRWNDTPILSESYTTTYTPTVENFGSRYNLNFFPTRVPEQSGSRSIVTGEICLLSDYTLNSIGHKTSSSGGIIIS